MSLAELLSAVCNHPDAPEWLKLGIIDLLNEKEHKMNYSVEYFIAEFQAITEPDVLDMEVFDD